MTQQPEKVHQSKAAGIFGLLAFTIFLLSLIVFGLLNPDFSFVNDYVSQLGAKGEPHALWWNVFGFGATGLLLSCFGVFYGQVLNDKIVGVLIAIFGFGFAFTAIPIDQQAMDTSLSKAHIVAITLGLAAWMLGLARLGSNRSLNSRVRFRANMAAGILALCMIGSIIGLWSMPVTHRLVFAVVFLWTALTSFNLVQHPTKE